MIFQHSVNVDCAPETLAEKIKSPRVLAYVSWPVLGIVPVEPAVPPEMFLEQKYLVKLRLFGLIPIGWQVIDVSCRHLSAEKGKFWFELRDNGHGQMISKWDHTITITQNGAGTLYKDRIEIKAGFLTPFVWVFASVLYRHRQRRLCKLALRGFDLPALFKA
ncbi:MAG: hypothetical protein HY280_09515 [Nitrospinae bacterium]|nr:hypothetical protein [Nitrospinota bacterium]